MIIFLLEYPRLDRTQDPLLSDIIFIIIALVIQGVETWNDIDLYGNIMHEWLNNYLHLPSWIPSLDTFNRVYSALNPQKLVAFFMKWMKY